MAWRDLAQTLFQSQKAIGTQREQGARYWDEPVLHWRVGVQEFPDRQRPLYGAFGSAGPVAGQAPTVMLGTPITGAADLALYKISFRIVGPPGAGFNDFGFFPAFGFVYTPQNTPDPIAFAPPTFPPLNRPFLRPRPVSGASGRAIVLSGQALNANIQGQAQAGPRFAVTAVPGDRAALTGPDRSFPANRDIDFPEPLIIPAAQFVAVTGLNELGTSGGNLRLDVSFLFREVSP